MGLETTISSAMKDIGNDIKEHTLFRIIKNHENLTNYLGQRPNDDDIIRPIFITDYGTNLTKNNL